MTAILACVLLGATLLAARARSVRSRRRLRRIQGAAAPSPSRRIDPRRLGPAAAGLAVWIALDGWPGVAAGIAAAVVTHHALRRIEPRAARSDRLTAAADLPFAAELLAAGLRAGAPPAVAVREVGRALGGPLGERLTRVAYGLALGAPAQDAWAAVRGVPGAERLVAAAARSSESGAALAGALTRLADDIRAARSAASEAAARRAGVLVVLPLGLCFLPAFILAGLVPIVLSVLHEVIP